MNKIVKNTLILTAITVVSGLLLGIVYDVTKEPIAQAQENTKQEAYRAVLSDGLHLKLLISIRTAPFPCLRKTDTLLTRLPRWLKEQTTAARLSDM